MSPRASTTSALVWYQKQRGSNAGWRHLLAPDWLPTAAQPGQHNCPRGQTGKHSEQITLKNTIHALQTNLCRYVYMGTVYTHIHRQESNSLIQPKCSHTTRHFQHNREVKVQFCTAGASHQQVKWWLYLPHRNCQQYFRTSNHSSGSHPLTIHLHGVQRVLGVSHHKHHLCDTDTYLEKFFKWRMYHGVRNKRQSIEGKKLCSLAQCSSFCFQVCLKIRNPFLKLSFVLGNKAADLI